MHMLHLFHAAHLLNLMASSVRLQYALDRAMITASLAPMTPSICLTWALLQKEDA